VNSATEKAHENFLRAANVPLPRVRAVDFAVLVCPECGEIENPDNIGRLRLCPKCGASVPWTMRGDPHKGC